MLVKSANELRGIGYRIFNAVGTPPERARCVADSLVESNLVGHDSHGVIRIPAYVRYVREGKIKPTAEIQMVRETATTALLDGGWCFGQVVARRGMELAMEKAQEHDVGVVALCHCAHIGRLGEYVVMTAERGFVGLIFCSSGLKGGEVAPFGGRVRALGTNPIAWGVPAGERPPIFLDYATSVVAEGKLRVAADKDEEIPLGWLLDKEGRPTRNPRDKRNGGALLPFGGHKGYALSVMIQLLGGGLNDIGFPLQSDYEEDQGAVLMAIRIEAFQPLATFERMVRDFVAHLKRIPRAPDCEEVLLPGEPEWRTKAVRERQGIPLPEATWERIIETGRTLGVEGLVD